MNNEEQLKQEAIVKYKTGSYPQLHPDHYAFIHGYLASAEPREKQIEQLVYLHNEDVNTVKLLNEQIAELKRDKQNLRADLRTARNNLQAKDTAYQLALKELEYAKTHCLFHSDCPTQKENAELKEQISIKDILIKELQEQKVFWKESSFDWRHKFFKLDKVKRLIKKDKELAKAKDFMLKLTTYLEGHTNYDFECELIKEVKQFLKESEVGK